MGEHTKGRLKRAGENIYRAEGNGSQRPVAQFTDFLLPDNRLTEDERDKLVHSWNACLNMQDPERDVAALVEALRKIASGDGVYGAQAHEYKEIARAALRLMEGKE